MKWARRIMLILLLGQGGCSYMQQVAHNVYGEPVDFVDETVWCAKLHRLACTTLEKIQLTEGRRFCAAYAQGFEEGFVDYIMRNGTGAPPAMPPFCLQRSALRNPEKQDDITEWYAGFRHGSSVAQETGLRERFVIPIGLPPRPKVIPLYMEKTEQSTAKSSSSTSSVQELHAPRPLPLEEGTPLLIPEPAREAIPMPPPEKQPAAPPPEKQPAAPVPGPNLEPELPRPLPKGPAPVGLDPVRETAPPPGLFPTQYLPPPPEPVEDPLRLPP
jgi:hypothetical protein